MTAPLKLAITGAAGRIGYSLAFRIAAGAMFGDQQPIELALLETPRGLDFLRGVEQELIDCAYPLIRSITVTDNPDTAFANADWIIMLASTPMTLQNYSRLDLLRANGSLYQEHGRSIERVAAFSRVLVVAEPCNTLCLLVQRQAHTVPAAHFFSLNQVDRMRATAIIAAKAGVPVGEVSRVTAWGNRSDLAFVDFHNAFINDQPAGHVITETDWARTVLEPTLVRRNHEVMTHLGTPPTGTTTQAIISTIRSITTPTPYGRRFSAGVISDGSYGVPKNLIFGFPIQTANGEEWSIVQGLYLDEHAQSRLQENVAELEHEAAVAGL